MRAKILQNKMKQNEKKIIGGGVMVYLFVYLKYNIKLN